MEYWKPEEHKPWNMQVEFVEGCSRMCSFCGIWGIWSKPENRIIKYMDFALADKLAKNVGDWMNGKRIEFAMHGEPLLHPKVLDLIKLFRRYGDKCQFQLTTNGDMLLNGKLKIEDLFDAGLNILLIDTYNEGDREKHLANFSNRNDIKIYDFYKDDFNPYHNNGCGVKALVFMESIGKVNKKRKQRVILNHAGNVNFDLVKKYGIFPLDAPLKKKCTRVYREMTVHYDGTVPMCCMDWKHEFIMGDINKERLEDIWKKDIWNEVRQVLYEKNRNFNPCAKCDYNGGFRIGFLNPVKEKGDIDKVLEYLKK